MHTLAITSFALAFFVMLFAVFYQRRDLHPKYGNTMGGQMTTGVIWILASLLCAAGASLLIPWYFSIPVFFLVFAFSFPVRTIVERIPKRLPNQDDA